MTTATITQVDPIILEDSIIMGRSELRRVLKDRISPAVLESLLAMFDRVLTVAPHNHDEARQAGRMALTAIQDCAFHNGCEALADSAIRDFWSDIQGWWFHNRCNDRACRTDCGHDRADCIGRWISRGGKHWVELWRGRYDYYYQSNSSGGSVCDGDVPIATALTVMQVMLDRGKWLPDGAKMPMVLVGA